MKTFNSPLVKVVHFTAKDVITTSETLEIDPTVRMHGIGSHAKGRGGYLPASEWEQEQINN